MKIQRNFFKKTLIIGSILLFFGTSIAPSICGDFNKSNVQIVKQDATISFLKDGPLAYWAFDECSGTIVEDQIHGYDGTINGATWTNDGYSGCALIFDGADDYVDLDDHATNLGINKTDDYSISANFKSTSSSTGCIYSMSHTNVARAFAYLDLNDDGTISYKTGDETCLFELYTPGSYNDGSWHLVEIKFYGDIVNPTLEIYVDGDLKGSLTEWLCPYLAEDFITAKIGRRSASADNTFDGTIDEVRIYKYFNPCLPPSKPIIEGPKKVNPGQACIYNFTSIDPQGYDLIYLIDWCDGTPMMTSSQIPSGVTFTMSHCWSEMGNIILRAKAIGLCGESDWSVYEIIVPRTQEITKNVLYKLFLNRFLILEKLLPFF